MINELTEDNFMMYAIKNYDNPSCIGMDEFLDDLKRYSKAIDCFEKVILT